MSAPRENSIYNEPAIVAQDGARVIDHDLSCGQCGYDLRGTTMGQACPECGHRIVTKKHDEQAALYSVYDELDILVQREGQATIIDRDWSCSSCGYNLRGLRVGANCPECGRIEWYSPAPIDKPSYARWLIQRQAATTDIKRWSIVVVAALFGGFWALLGAFWSVFAGHVGVVVVGPATEEIMKIALVATLVEVRPYLFKSAGQILIGAVASATVFAFIENVMYIIQFDLSDATIAWRWTMCVLLHVGCTTLAATGVTRVWRRSTQELRPPQFRHAMPWIIGAIVIHGVYNGGAVLMTLTGFEF